MRKKNKGKETAAKVVEFVLSTRVYFDARLIDLLTVAELNLFLVHSKYFQLWCRQLLYTVRGEGQIVMTRVCSVVIYYLVHSHHVLCCWPAGGGGRNKSWTRAENK